MTYHDIHDVMPATPDCAPAHNDAAVCAVLKWAKRTGTDLVDVADVCAVLGVDLSGSIERAREVR